MGAKRATPTSVEVAAIATLRLIPAFIGQIPLSSLSLPLLDRFPLPDAAIGNTEVKILADYQGILRERMGSTWEPHPDGWIVSIDSGLTPLRAHGVTDLVKGLGKRCDPPIDAQPHDCRRFSVTQLIDAGVDVRTVQRRHGHASLATTEVYALAVPESDIAAAEVMGELLPADFFGAALTP